MEVRVKSGACEPTGTVWLGTGIAGRFYGRAAGASNADARRPAGCCLCYHRFVVRIGVQMRLILVTGKGGAGASTLAAATAAALAGGGRRTLALGVGRALAAAFGRPLGQRPVPLAADLWALEAVPGHHDEPGPFLDWLRDLFAWRNMDETVADAIAALPGLGDPTRALAPDG